MSVAPPYDPQMPFESEADSTVSTLVARPEPAGSLKLVALIPTLVPLFRYAVAPLTVRAPPVGAVVSAGAVTVRPEPVSPAPFVAVASALCVVEETSNVYTPFEPPKPVSG